LDETVSATSSDAIAATGLNGSNNGFCGAVVTCATTG
jgi:hypothetical protein